MQDRTPFARRAQAKLNDVVNYARDTKDAALDAFNRSGIQRTDAALLGLGVGGGLMAPAVSNLVDMGTGEETGFGEAPRNIAGGALGVSAGAAIPLGIAQRYEDRAARNRHALRGGAVGALMGGFSSGAIMVSNDRPAPQPGAPESIAASISMKDRNEITALLDAHGAL